MYPATISSTIEGIWRVGLVDMFMVYKFVFNMGLR